MKTLKKLLQRFRPAVSDEEKLNFIASGNIQDVHKIQYYEIIDNGFLDRYDLKADFDQLKHLHNMWCYSDDYERTKVYEKEFDEVKKNLESKVTEILKSKR